MLRNRQGVGKSLASKVFGVFGESGGCNVLGFCELKVLDWVELKVLGFGELKVRKRGKKGVLECGAKGVMFVMFLGCSGASC